MSPGNPLLKLRGKLIVSCQASAGDFFREPSLMARFARAAVSGGAAGIRANGPDDIRAIRSEVDVPIIGIQKQNGPDGQILITPTIESAQALINAGADLVAFDCTTRGQAFGAFERLSAIKRQTQALVLADIATLEEARAAAEAGADAVLSTLRGYTDETAHLNYFDVEFLRELTTACSVPVIAEGRIHFYLEAQAAISAGAFAVVVGTAITRPRDITRMFATAIDSAHRRRDTTRHVIAVDLGGTNLKYGIVSSTGEMLFHAVTATPDGGGRSALLTSLKQAVAKGLEEASARALTIEAVGVATAGWVDKAAGSIAYATENLPGWTGTQVAQELQNSFGLSVSVENDANALAVGEKYFGSARNLTDFVVITLGTGIGGGCYIGGKLNRGAHHFANAFGHIPLIPDGLPCTCGRFGCLEVYTNSAALIRYAGDPYSSSEQVIEAAGNGDENAQTAIATLGRYLARGCAVLVGLLDPQALILSGGLMVNNPMLLQVLQEELIALVPAWEIRNLQIISSTLGYLGGVFGAAALTEEIPVT